MAPKNFFCPLLGLIIAFSFSIVGMQVENEATKLHEAVRKALFAHNIVLGTEWSALHKKKVPSAERRKNYENYFYESVTTPITDKEKKKATLDLNKYLVLIDLILRDIQQKKNNLSIDQYCDEATVLHLACGMHFSFKHRSFFTEREKTPLANFPHYELIQKLLDAGATVTLNTSNAKNGRPPLFLLLASFNVKYLDSAYYLQNKGLLHCIVQRMLELGSPVNYNDTINCALSLCFSDELCEEELATMLVNAGAELNENVSWPDNFTNPAPLCKNFFMRAVSLGKVKLLEAMLKRKIDCNMQLGLPKFSYPFSVALAKNYTQVTEMLLKAGADPNLVIPEACRFENLEIVGIIVLIPGLNLNKILRIIDRDEFWNGRKLTEETLLSNVCKWQNTSIPLIKLLLEKGADPKKISSEVFLTLNQEIQTILNAYNMTP